MSKYITEIEVSSGRKDEQRFLNKGFKKIDVNLNKTGGEAVYLWSKKQEKGSPITRVQVSYNDGMADGLTNAGYVQIEKPTPGGWLWYFQGTSEYDMKIEELEVTKTPEDEAQKVCSGWEKVGCNLTGVNGPWLFLWVKREKQTYICEVQGTLSGGDKTLFNDGFMRIDKTTNTGNNFIWYRKTTDPTRALTDLKVSINDKKYQQYLQQGYSVVRVNLNEGNNNNPVFLWYKSGGASPIKTMHLINPNSVDALEKEGVTVINYNLNVGNCTPARYLCFYQ